MCVRVYVWNGRINIYDKKSVWVRGILYCCRPIRSFVYTKSKPISRLYFARKYFQFVLVHKVLRCPLNREEKRKREQKPNKTSQEREKERGREKERRRRRRRVRDERVRWRRRREKYGRVMVENPSSELKRDVVKLNNVCNIYTREELYTWTERHILQERANVTFLVTPLQRPCNNLFHCTHMLTIRDACVTV